jgi:hypothetical protein
MILRLSLVLATMVAMTGFAQAKPLDDELHLYPDGKDIGCVIGVAEGMALDHQAASDDNAFKVINECRHERPSWFPCVGSEYYCVLYIQEAVVPFIKKIIDTKPGTGAGPPDGFTQ